MFKEQDNLLCSESFLNTFDRCYEVQIHCAKEMVKATCEIWSKLMCSYVTGVTRGLGGVTKCYRTGVDSFCKSFDSLTKNPCDNWATVTKCAYHGHCKTSEARELDYLKAKVARAEFFEAIKTNVGNLDDKNGEILFKNLKDMAEDLGKKKARVAKFECFAAIETMEKVLSCEEGPRAVTDFFNKLTTEAGSTSNTKGGNTKMRSKAANRLKTTK